MTRIASRLHLQGMARRSPDELMCLVQGGDALAFEVLYYRIFPILRDFVASRAIAVTPVDDVVQEVFCRVWEQRDRFARRSSIKTYLLGVALNVLREYHRNVDRAVPWNPNGAHDPVTEEEADQDSWCEGLSSALCEARSLLSDRQQAAIRLVYDEQISPEKAAEHLGCSPQALRRRLQEARHKLHGLLKKPRRDVMGADVTQPTKER